jgi:hypothetical protein
MQQQQQPMAVQLEAAFLILTNKLFLLITQDATI